MDAKVGKESSCSRLTHGLELRDELLLGPLLLLAPQGHAARDHELVVVGVGHVEVVNEHEVGVLRARDRKRIIYVKVILNGRKALVVRLNLILLP